MTIDGVDHLQWIAAELSDVAGRLTQISEELSAELATQPAPMAPAPVAPAPSVPEYPAWQGDQPDQAWPDQAWQDRQDDSAAGAWDRFGSRSVAWIGGAITLVGVVLLLVLAAQRGWLGPAPRLLCGAGMAAALLGIGARLHRTPAGQLGSFALGATGIAVLYLDTVAATGLYHYLPVVGGLLVGLLIAGGGLLLADRWTAPGLAIFVVVGAAVGAPIVTHGFTAELVGFLLVLQGSALPVHIRRGWRWLALAAGVPPILASLAMTGLHRSDGTATLIVAVVTSTVGIVLAVLAARRSSADPVPLALLLGAPVPTLAAAPLAGKPLAVAGLAFVAALLLGLWAVNLRWPQLPVRFAGAAGAAGAVAVAQTTVTLLDGTGRTAAFLCQAMVFALIAMLTSSRGTLVVGALYGAVGGALAVGFQVRPSLVAEPPRLPPAQATLVIAVVVAILLTLTSVTLCWAGIRLRAPDSLPMWIMPGLAALYGSSVLCGTLLARPDRDGFLLGHVLVTVCWAITALALLVRGIAARPARITGLVLVGAAVAKLVLFDLANLDGITRVAAFLGAGLVLLAAGVRYARLVADYQPAGDPAADRATPYESSSYTE
jgi:uncharacterized membrane protein